MKKLNFWLLASLFVGALAFTACSSSNDDDGGNPGGEGGSGGFTPIPVQPSNMTMAKLSGFVTSEYGYPLSGVKVTSGNEVAYTNANGAFSLNSINLVSGRAIVRFSSASYADVVRSVEFKEGEVWEVQMKYADTRSITPTVDNNIVVDYSNNVKVDIPANSLVDGQGNVVTEPVVIRSAYLNPEDEDFASQMPGGDLAAVRENGSDAQLISYGMISIDATANGKELQLKEGSEATLTFPAAPEGMEAYDEIPLWSFDEEKGLWIEEGIARKQADGTYVGTIKHFSWHNLDYPESRATIAVEVYDEAGKAVPFQKVIVGQTSGVTDANGKFSTFVPTNTDFVVTVKSADYANYSPEVTSENINITQAGFERKIRLTLPTISHLSGAIVSGGKGVLASVSLSYGGEETKPVMSGVDGKYYMKLPFGYKGAATINIITADGTVYRRNIVLDGTDRAENFDVDPVASETGTVTFTGTDIDLIVPMTINDIPAFAFGGVVIMGDDWMCMENYSSSSSTNVNFGKDYFSWSMSTENQWSNIYLDGGTVNMVVEGQKAKITVSGNARYSRQGGGVGEQGSGNLSGTFKYSILANIVEGASNVPSWVPQVSGSNPVYSYSITNSSKLGDGWIFFYNNNETIDQYRALVNAAKANFGDPYYVDDDPDSDWSKSYVFIKGTQALQLLYTSSTPWEGWTPEPQSILGGHHGWSEVPITVRAYSNVTVPFDDVVVGHKR